MKIPQPKINPEAVPWARAVTDLTKNTTASLSPFEDDNNAKLKGIQAMIQGLSQQATELENFLANQRPIVIQGGTGAGFNTDSTWGAKASTVISVPSGYSNASVYALGYGVIQNNPYSIGGRRSRIFMNGQYSVESVGTFDGHPTDGTFFILESAMGRELSGLGSSFTVNFDMWTNVSNTNAGNRAAITVIASFY